MGEFSINWDNRRNVKITDMNGALEILNITKTTLIDWQKKKEIESFKSVFNGRRRKCFKISDLELLVGTPKEKESK